MRVYKSGSSGDPSSQVRLWQHPVHTIIVLETQDEADHFQEIVETVRETLWEAVNQGSNEKPSLDLADTLGLAFK